MSDAGKKVTIYTDGACSGNPGPGGWGAILIFGDNRKELKGGEAETTNNRMEVTAAIKAIEALNIGSKIPIELHTDSSYLRDGITKWINNWKRNGWKTSQRKPVKNDDLWKSLDKIRRDHDISWHWVKGHAGHPLNERADELAREGMQPYQSEHD